MWTFCISKKKGLYLIGNIWHLHEVRFIKPTNVPFGEMTGDQQNSLPLEHWRPPRMSEVTRGVGAFFPLAGEVYANFLGHVLWEHVWWIHRDVPEIKHAWFSLFFGGSIHLYCTTRLLLSLANRSFFLTPIQGSQVMLISTATFSIWVAIRIRMG